MSEASQVAAGRGPLRGPCAQCGVMFKSKRPGKKFCTLACYLNSEERRAALIERNKAGAKQVTKQCAECGVQITRKASHMATRNVFCGAPCKRAFFDARFDRYIASPEEVALPQNYDEFLNRETLECPVSGCEWEGTDLGRHANLAHGIVAREFKKQLGFNVGTGLVTPTRSREISEATVLGTLEMDDIKRAALARGRETQKERGHGLSLEAREHHAKARALSDYKPGPMSDDTKRKLSELAKLRAREEKQVACVQCAKPFISRRVGQPQERCHECVRKNTLERNRTEPWKPIACDDCGAVFVATRNIARQVRGHRFCPQCGRRRNPICPPFQSR